MKIRLIIDPKCKNCEYIVDQLKKTGLDKYIDEVIDIFEYDKVDELEAVPSIEIIDEEKNERKIDYVSGDLRGLVKIIMYVMKSKGVEK